MRTSFGWLVAAVLLVPAFPARAGRRPNANPAQPTFTDNAITTDPGALEIEVGGVLTPRVPNRAPLYAGLSTLFKYGIAPHYDVRIGVAEGFDAGDGGDVALSFKATLLEPGQGHLGFAIEPYLSVATPPAAQQDALGSIFLATLPFAKRFDLDANVVTQGSWVGRGAYRFEVDPGATLSAGIAGGLGIFGEVYGSVPLGQTESAVAGAGLTLTAQSNLVFDTCVTRTLTRSADPWTFQAGITYSFFLPGEGKKPGRPGTSTG